MNKPPKILVVDDDPAILFATQRTLEQAGYTILAAPDGETALALVSEQKPNLVLLDVNLPAIDGFEVCRRIKADPSLAGIYVVMVSGSRTDANSKVDGLEIGADDYLTRPIANRELVARIGAMLRIHAAETDLRASVVQWSATFDAVSDAIVLTDANYTILKCNRAAAEMWQIPLEALIEKKCYQVVHGAETPASACPLAMVRGTKHRQVLSFAQDERWLEAKVDPMFDANGNFSGTVHVITDITERVRTEAVQQQAEDALRESEDKFKYVFDHSVIGKSITLPSGEINVNQAMCKMLGYSHEELQNRKWQEISHPDDLEITQNAINALLSGEREAVRFIKRYIHKNGSIVWADVGTALRRDKNGKPLYFMTTINDITARKQAEDALRDSEEKYHAVVDKANDGIMIGQDGMIKFSNPSFAAMLGYKVSEVEGIEFSRLIPPENVELLLERYQKRLAGVPVPSLYETVLLHKSGARIPLEVNASIIQFAGKPADLVMTRDITERKQAEEALSRHAINLARSQQIGKLGSWDWDVAKNSLSWSDEIYRIWGIGRDFDLSFDNISGMIHPDDRELNVKMVREFLATRDEGEYEFRIICPDRTVKYICQSIEVTRAPSGQPIRLFGIMQDITERKQAEEALRTLSARQEAILDAVPDILMEVDQNKIYSWANPAGLAFFGEDAIGKDAAFYFEGEQDTYGIVKPLFNGSEGVIYVESWQRRKDGENRLLAWWCRVLKDKHGNVIGALSSAHDITERKQAEEALRKSETRLRAILDATPFPIALVDVQDNNIDFWSSSALTLFGHTAPTAEQWYQIAYPDPKYRQDVIERWKPALEKAQLTAQSVNTGEYQVTCRDGSVRICELYATFLADSLIVTFNDITERKQVEAALRQSDAFGQAILNNSPIGISVRSRTGQLLSANAAWKKIWAIPEADFNEDASRQRHALHFDERDDYLKPYQADVSRVYEQGGHLHLSALQVNHPRPGGAQWVSQHFYAIQDAQGQVDRVVVMTEDITARKQAEEALKERTNFLDKLIESSALSTWISDGQGTVIRTNPACLEFFGATEDEVIGKYNLFKDVVIEKQGYMPDIQRVFENGEVASVLIDYDFGAVDHVDVKNVTHKFINSIFTPILDGHGKVSNVIVQSIDLTEIKKAEQEIHQLNLSLEQRVEERTQELRDAQEKLVRQEKLALLGQLAGGVGHELRNPLAVINNAVYYLKIVQPEANEKVKEYLSMIQNETRTAEKIITDLLDFARLKSVDQEPVAVAEMVHSVLARYPAPGIVAVSLDIPASLPRVYVDPRQIEQVLGNLVVNACQAMPEGGRLSVTGKQLSVNSEPLVKTNTLNTGNCVLITVRDTGVGITPENMGKLFEPLFTTKPKGIGLGLAVCKKLIEANGGWIEAQSEPGKGSIFTVYLPVQSVTASDSEAVSSKRAIATPGKAPGSQ